MENKIFNKVVETVYAYNTSNPYEICEHLDINIKPVNYGKAFIINDGYDKTIFINDNYEEYSKVVLCAHEVGHAILHEHDTGNHFDEIGSIKQINKEKEANLFAAYLLFDDDKSNPFGCMSAYDLQNFIENKLVRSN